MSFQKELMRIALNLYYSYQEIRISSKNQIRDIIRKLNENIAFNEVEEKKENKTFDKKYNDDKLGEIMEQLLLQDKITNKELEYYEKCKTLINGPTLIKMLKCSSCEKRNKTEIQVGGIEDMEKESSKIIKELIKSEPIWIHFLSKIKGMGEILGANLIKSLGYCEKADTVSKLWAFTGNNVVNGFAPKREKGKKLGFNLKLKTLTWKISDSLMKGNKGYYRTLYDNEKAKQLEREFDEGYLAENYNGYTEKDTKLSKGHAHNRALRKMRKHFLSHYWEASRSLIGLPTKKTYVEGVLKHEHIIHWKEVIELEIDDNNV